MRALEESELLSLFMSGKDVILLLLEEEVSLLIDPLYCC